MAVIQTSDGQMMAHMLAIVRYRASLLPPYLYMHCRILGEGVYEYAHEGYNESTLFGLMVEALRSKLSNRVLYIEVSNLSQKMFGYKELRQQQFFPVHWMSIHNSLHSHTPEERIQKRLENHINNAYAKGVITDEVKGEDDFRSFTKLLKHHNWQKPKRYIPDEKFFRAIKQEGHGRLYLTRYRNHVVGCSAVAYSNQNAYLWYAAFRRKSFAMIHPDELTLWHAIKDAHQRGSHQRSNPIVYRLERRDDERKRLCVGKSRAAHEERGAEDGYGHQDELLPVRQGGKHESQDGVHNGRR